MKNNIYVVELKWDKDSDWVPTVGAALNREDARREAKEWKSKVAGAKIRIVRYRAWQHVR